MPVAQLGMLGLMSLPLTEERTVIVHRKETQVAASGHGVVIVTGLPGGGIGNRDGSPVCLTVHSAGVDAQVILTADQAAEVASALGRTPYVHAETVPA